MPRRTTSKKSRSSKKKAPEEEFWEITGILAERTDKGFVEYLVKWKDDPKTGKEYPPEWSREVTSAAKEEWENIKAEKRLQEDQQQRQQQLELQAEHQAEPGPAPGPELDTQKLLQEQQQQEQQSEEQQSGPPDHDEQQADQKESSSDSDSDDSQPPRPAHRRRINQGQKKRPRSNSLSSASSNCSLAPPRKVLRSDTGGSLEPPVSLVSSPSIPSPSEVSELPEAVALDLPDVVVSDLHDGVVSELPDEVVSKRNSPERSRSMVVAIPEPANINRADYLSIFGSQSSGNSTQPVAERDSQDSLFSIAQSSQAPASQGIESQETVGQGTVPDSQETSDRSWTQAQIDVLPSSCRLTDPQPPGSVPDSSSRVIPDSLEGPSTAATHQSRATQDRQASSPSKSLNAPEAPVQESHETGSPDIPSRQPDELRDATGPRSPALSESVSHSTPASRVPQPPGSSSSAEAILTQSDASPRFLTQPPFSLLLEPPQSSVHSRIFESPAHPVAEVVSTTASGPSSASDPGASQAAQIVARDFEPLSQHLAESSSPSESEQIRHQLEAVAVPSQPTAPAGVARHQTTAATPPTKQSTPLSSYKRRRMENETPEQAAARRHSALDAELSGIFRWDDDDDEKAASAHVASQPVSQQTQHDQASVHENVEHVAPAEEGSAPHAHTELPLLTTDMHHAVVDLPSSQGRDSPEHARPATAHAAVVPEIEGVATLDTAAEPQAPTPQKPVAAELADIFGSAFVGADLELPPTTAPEFIHAEQSTVSLADISRQPEPAYRDIPLVSFVNPEETLMQESFTDTAPSEPVQAEHSPSESSASFAGPPSAIKEHIVTLPYQASLREKYDSIIVAYKNSIKAFNRSFSDEDYSEPDLSLVARIDELFNDLLNLCDYPGDAVGSDLEKLSPDDQAKYCCDANPKFNFLRELLRGVENHLNILIVARSPDLLRLLCHLAWALKMPFSCKATGHVDPGGSGPKMVLALPTEFVDPQKFDVVIGYDHSFRHSSIARGLSTHSGGSRHPLVLVLVTTHSIEHIDLHIPEDLTLLERKSVLISGIVRARDLVERPDPNHPEPHEIAAQIIEFLSSDEEPFLFEPTPLPENILDVYVHSQSRSQLPSVVQRDPETGRKRKHNESDEFESKRPRVLSADEAVSAIGTGLPPVSDEVKALLKYATPRGDTSRPQVLINVPHTALQVLAEKFSDYEHRLEASNRDAEYRAVITSLEKRVKEYERSMHKIYETDRAALQDRSRFESEKRKIEVAMQSAAEQAEREAEKARKKIAELEATVARLTQDPNASDPQDTPLARSEKLLQEAQAKIVMLEKRLENAHREADYIRSTYQDASSRASELQSENNQLRRQNEDLSEKAAENSVRIHEIQESNTAHIYLQQIAELKAQIQSRDMELERAREELRQLKNGRRETRQSSVPRSPRMGMMSPRTIARGYGAPSSRGASPAAGGEGMQFYGQQPGNGRWDHLRG
ncbi:hypothetical protein BBK36DRAFT_1115161 [Trichoderma citrinoviride]|uniref:Chromo domain-containing protein n=1 Tax=Trichoderma citrinoviride TaxID=58853 RepID=A0A2T4BF80_9HYPO|nr:hypothetical protein BBK36DRAFT_1115161 [Trichoderma citrinoviride]PTB67990.1 hypothetical protein BBK36DRAFT_1115161 [Trichoderma citrinoviride]